MVESLLVSPKKWVFHPSQTHSPNPGGPGGSKQGHHAGLLTCRPAVHSCGLQSASLRLCHQRLQLRLQPTHAALANGAAVFVNALLAKCTKSQDFGFNEIQYVFPLNPQICCSHVVLIKSSSSLFTYNPPKTNRKGHPVGPSFTVFLKTHVLGRFTKFKFL